MGSPSSPGDGVWIGSAGAWGYTPSANSYTLFVPAHTTAGLYTGILTLTLVSVPDSPTQNPNN